MKVPHLPINILDHHVERPPRRKLKLTCHVSNPSGFDICILDAWVEIEALNGLRLAEGKLFQSMHNRVDPAIIPSGKNGNGSFHIELASSVLRDIEERRAGSDVEIVISSRVLVAQVTVVNDILVLSAPFETSFESNGDQRVKYSIPQSEWIKLLKALEWSELELLELPLSRLRAIPTLARAFSRLENAQDFFRRSDWEETMLNCRKAFEAIVQDVSGKSDMINASEVFASLIGEPDKADRFDKLAKSLGEYLHLGRHETPPGVSIKRADSELALLLTGALLRYLSQQ